MGCNCKAGRDLSYLQRKYGVGGPKSKETHIRENFVGLLKTIPVWILGIVLLPVIIIMSFFNKKGRAVSIDKLFFRKG